MKLSTILLYVFGSLIVVGFIVYWLFKKGSTVFSPSTQQPPTQQPPTSTPPTPSGGSTDTSLNGSTASWINGVNQGGELQTIYNTNVPQGSPTNLQQIQAETFLRHIPSILIRQPSQATQLPNQNLPQNVTQNESNNPVYTARFGNSSVNYNRNVSEVPAENPLAKYGALNQQFSPPASGGGGTPPKAIEVPAVGVLSRAIQHSQPPTPSSPPFKAPTVTNTPLYRAVSSVNKNVIGVLKSLASTVSPPKKRQPLRS